MREFINLRMDTTLSSNRKDMQKVYLVYLAYGIFAVMMMLLADMFVPQKDGYLPVGVYAILLIAFSEDISRRVINNHAHFTVFRAQTRVYIALWAVSFLPLAIVHVILAHLRNFPLAIITQGILLYITGVVGYYFWVWFSLAYMC